VTFAMAAFEELMLHKVFIGPVDPKELGQFYATAAWAVGWRILVALMLISTLDLLYQRWQYAQDNRMSFQEVRDENKQSDGNPEMKMKMRGAARKNVSMRRMMENMTDTTIVITNPTHYAVGLKYKRDETATPIMMAKGMNRNARKFRERAVELDIEVLENVELAQGLYKHGQVGKPIPALYFQAVAQILAELYRRGYRKM
jgi:flagellar biosynthesis protein FlhB